MWIRWTPNDVIGNSINAMLKSLDPYTEYYPEEKLKDLKRDIYRQIRRYRFVDLL